MMKSIFLWLAIVFTGAVCLGYNWGTNPGDGSAGNPYQISTAEQLNSIGVTSSLMSKHFILVNDIDMSSITGTAFNRIGNASYRFQGMFDGQDHTISNFSYVTATGTNLVGLFAYTQGSTIKNVHMVNVNVSSPGLYVGGLVAFHDNHSVMSRCSVSGRVAGNMRVGGLAGQHEEYSKMTDCFSSVRVQGSSRAGVLVGENKDSSTMVRCRGNGIAAGTGTARNLGGLAGAIDSASVEDCFASGHVVGISEVGGLVGYTYNGSILSSVADVNVIGDAAAGGLTGVLEYYASAENCYASGPVEGGENTGGLVGEVWYSSVENCFSAGAVSGSTNIGGLIGYMEETYSIVDSSYWDTITSSVSDGVGSMATDPAGVSGLPTSLMQQQASFAGWDFLGEGINGDEEIWRMCANGVAYPRLSWEFSVDGDFVCPDGVGMEDMEALAESWYADDTDTNFCITCDVNGDGVINLSDYAALAEHWLEDVLPFLVLSEQHFFYTLDEGGPNPAQTPVTVTNLGRRSASYTVEYPGGQPDWLDVTPTSGMLGQGDSDVITTSVDVIGPALQGGLYEQSVAIVSAQAVNSPQIYTVHVNVIEHYPVLSVTPDTISFEADEGGPNPIPATLSLENTGDQDSEFTIEYSGGQPAWLDVTPTSGTLLQGDSINLTVSVDVIGPGLAGSTYSGAFDIVDSTSPSSPVEVTVSLEVN